MNTSWLHVTPKTNRQKITEQGLKPGFGGGFATGLSPLMGRGSVELNGVYVTKDPDNLGVIREFDTKRFDLWSVEIDESLLVPDFPALVERGAYIEENGFWFKHDNALHDHYGETIPYDVDPELAVKFSGTGLFPYPVPADKMVLL